MKIAVVVIVYNLHPEIFLLQIAAIRKLCKDKNYTIEIVDNSSNIDKAQDIRYHARLLGLTYHRTYSSSENSSDSHAFSANLSYQKFKDFYNIFAYFDHDLIPVKEFSIQDMLGNKLAAGLGQGAKKKYFWPGCVMFNNDEIDHSVIDFSPNNEFGLDTGGDFYKLIEKYGEDECIFFNEEYHQNPYFVDAQYGYYSMINDGMFLHFVNASGWNPLEGNENRINSLLNIAKEKLNATKEDINIHEM